VSEDHLDRYVDYKAYVEAKRRIFNNAETIVENSEDELTHAELKANVKSFGLTSDCDWQVDIEQGLLLGNQQSVLELKELTVQGVHNALNVAAAFALIEAAGVVITQDVVACAKNYKGMPHRSQLAAIKNNVTYINDSKATNVGATVAAINSFSPRFDNKIILIAGGDSKGADLSSLEETIEKHVKAVICFGKDGQAIAQLSQAKSKTVNDLAEAVKVAEQLANEGDCVLLSPACASLDMFANYIQRGEQFEQMVEAL